MRCSIRAAILLLLAYVAICTAGCASNAKVAGSAGEDSYLEDENDPWEEHNRAVFRFNDKFDEKFLEPVARGYRKVLPPALRLGIGNMFRNLFEPTVIINDLLQGKIKQAGQDTGRFLLNTTVGVLGFFEVAESVGWERHNEDFGQTLAVWGVDPGPYVVLPFLGPSNIRDGVGLIPYYFATDPRVIIDNLPVTAALIGVDAINLRAQLLGASRILEMQLDPYIFTRESYRQRRADLIYDGAPPLEDFEK